MGLYNVPVSIKDDQSQNYTFLWIWDDGCILDGVFHVNRNRSPAPLAISVPGLLLLCLALPLFLR